MRSKRSWSSSSDTKLVPAGLGGAMGGPVALRGGRRKRHFLTMRAPLFFPSLVPAAALGACLRTEEIRAEKRPNPARVASPSFQQSIDTQQSEIILLRRGNFIIIRFCPFPPVLAAQQSLR